ncbi:MAG: efflux RND transporter periplasmic adaptor subunit [Betaproteobacteria bacterium]|nr:efflux RND transporter periplasmic adaptor subunit [Betaproteobacteria bacterium]
MNTRFTRRRVIGGLIVLLVAGALAGAVALRIASKAGAAPAGTGVPNVLEFTASDLASVQAKSLARWLPVSGTLEPVRQATVKAKVSGEVRQITVREGEAVKAGQLLARIDTSDLDVRLIERQGQLESAQAQAAMAEKTLHTNQKLLKQNFISQNAFDSAESNLNVTRGSVMSAQAQVRLAQNALKDAVAVSPLSGIVAKRHVQPGEKVGFDAPLVTVVDLKDLELQALVPAMEIPELRLGMTVDLTVDGFGERKFTGRIERISPSTVPGTRAIHIFVGIPNAKDELRGGMFATGRIALGESGATKTLPATAVRTDAGQPYVWLIDDGKLLRRSVTIGRRDDEAGLVELKSELPAGAQVLATRFDNLKEGAPAVVRAPATTPAKTG